jgi:hypothetical protein
MKQQLSEPPTDEKIIEFFKARAVHPLIRTDLEALQPGVPQIVRGQLAPIHCWKCGARIKAVRGYVFAELEVPDEQVFVALRKVSDTRQLTALTADLRKRDDAITLVGFNYSKTAKGQYFSARCPACSAILGTYYMTVSSFFPAESLCDFPDCECCYSPELHCEGCEYHEARLQ